MIRPPMIDETGLGKSEARYLINDHELPAKIHRPHPENLRLDDQIRPTFCHELCEGVGSNRPVPIVRLAESGKRSNQVAKEQEAAKRLMGAV